MPATILFLVEIHFTEWHYRRFGIDLLKSRGFDVTVLDFTKWIAPGYYQRYRDKTLACPERVEIDGPEALARQVVRLLGERVIAFDNIGYGKDASFIRRQLFSAPNALRATWNLGLLPQPTGGGVLAGVKQLFSRTDLPQRVFNRTRRFLTSYRMGPPDLAILSGRLSDAGALAAARHKVWAHAFDYDTYLGVAHRRVGGERVDRYAVYLDEDIVDHPDLQHCGFKPVTTAERFYPRLNRFFSEVERALGLPVVIAAHPKADHQAHPERFAGRESISGRSAELVRDGALVIGHASCSLNFPMLWRKPVAIVTSDDLERSYLGPYIAARAAVTDATPFNIDRNQWPLDRQRMLMVDEGAYDDYREAYIKAGGPDKPVWEIFADYVEGNL